MNLTDNHRCAYEASLRERRRAATLSYKLTGGGLNDKPMRKPEKVLRGKGVLPRG